MAITSQQNDSSSKDITSDFLSHQILAVTLCQHSRFSFHPPHRDRKHIIEQRVSRRSRPSTVCHTFSAPIRRPRGNEQNKTFDEDNFFHGLDGLSLILWFSVTMLRRRAPISTLVEWEQCSSRRCVSSGTWASGVPAGPLG